MSSVKKLRGIVLRATKYAEADLILQMILVNGEKISLLARGAVKSKKRFGGGVLQPTHFIEIQFKPASGERLGTLQEALLVEDFAGLRTDYDRMELGLFCLNAISRVSQEGDAHAEGLFNLLGHALRGLERCQNLQLFKLSFCLKVLFQQGVLEAEPWMTPFLKNSLSQIAENETGFSVTSLQAQWAESQLGSYLKTAGTHGAF
jgi:DNA repair protein RecO (recombination protein O)